MKTYQTISGDNYGLDEEDLSLLFWMTAGIRAFQLEDVKIKAIDIVLLFMWLGPCQLSDVPSAHTAVRTISSWILKSPQRLGFFEGFCGRSDFNGKLRLGKMEYVLCLNEGKVEQIRTKFPPRNEHRYFVRNLQMISFQANLVPGFDDLRSRLLLKQRRGGDWAIEEIPELKF
jgi:hypothetical protein